jgi:hypothetical protein
MMGWNGCGPTFAQVAGAPAAGPNSVEFGLAFSNRQASAAFSIRPEDGVDWLIRPGGERFFSFGVCCVTMGVSSGQFDPDNPGYCAWQQYTDARSWADVTLERLQAWGVTTLGAWSDFQTFKRSPEPNTVFTPVLHIGSTAGAPWWDMWDPKIVERMDQVAREQILPLRDDPRVVGYYTDNEMGWWNAPLFKMTLEHAPTSGQRQRLMELLRQTYHNDWGQLLKDFEPEGVGNWQDLNRHGMLYLRPGGNGVRTMRRFLGILADRYYSLARDIIRKYDQRALIFGDRYQSFFYPEVARASAPYVDAVSSNVNAPWNDGTFPRFYLDTLHSLTKKPILVGEFYMAARQNRSGNQNDRGIYPVVESQKERAAGFRTTLRGLLNVPYVIGADWFQYYDEPTHGRDDGENFDFGLVDIHDRPYEELTAAASAMDLPGLKAAIHPPRLDASQGVPLAPSNPLGQFKPTIALRDWDRERGFVKPLTEFPLADLYICWDKKAIYLGLYAQDIVEDAFYRTKMVPKSDRAQWVIYPGTAKPIRARIGAGMEPILNDSSVQLTNLSGLNLNVRNIAAVELPAALFDRRRFKAGDMVEIGSTFFTHCQANRADWRATFKLTNER